MSRENICVHVYRYVCAYCNPLLEIVTETLEEYVSAVSPCIPRVRQHLVD